MFSRMYLESNFLNYSKVRTIYKYASLLIIFASKIRYFFENCELIFLTIYLLMLLQLETFAFLSFCIPVFGLSQKQTLRDRDPQVQSVYLEGDPKKPR